MSNFTSLSRTLAAISHQEPDRVPLFLLFTIFGAKENNISIKEYYSNPDNLVEFQMRLQQKYGSDCLYGFYYASREIEAMGGISIFVPDGPPVAGTPPLKKLSDIDDLQMPVIEETPCLTEVLTYIKGLKKEAGDAIPIIGVVMSPFSLPVIQLGFDHYFDLMFLHPEYFNKLIKFNEEFCIKWANAQVEAGATAICYFDPVSSPTIIAPAMYKFTGKKIAARMIEKIKAPVATHYASGRSLAIVDDTAETGALVMGASSLDNIIDLKEKCKNKITILGNLNGLELCKSDIKKTEQSIKDLIKKAGSGGGLIISDNHGEIPYHTSPDNLTAIKNAVEKWGTYPI